MLHLSEDSTGRGIRVVATIKLALHTILLALYWNQLDTLCVDITVVCTVYRRQMVLGDVQVWETVSTVAYV